APLGSLIDGQATAAGHGWHHHWRPHLPVRERVVSRNSDRHHRIGVLFALLAGREDQAQYLASRRPRLLAVVRDVGLHQFCSSRWWSATDGLSSAQEAG